MSFLSWILLGLVAGFIGRKIVTKRGDGPLLHIVLGIVAIAGGWLLSLPRVRWTPSVGQKNGRP
jgi:uncharacterized membrane protein YeaQ/YmgE (transglycosylase-associated protein family)